MSLDWPLDDTDIGPRKLTWKGGAGDGFGLVLGLQALPSAWLGPVRREGHKGASSAQPPPVGR